MGTFFGLVTLALLVMLLVALVNPSLVRNKKTGAVPSRKQMATGLGLLAFLSLVAAVITTDDAPKKAVTADSTPKPAAAPPIAAPQLAAAIDSRIKPETIVMFPKGEAACLTKEALQQFIELAASQRATKANALFDASGDGPQCIMLSPKTRYKVIDAEYNAPEMPEAAVLEVVGEDVKAAEGGAFVLVVDNSMVSIIKAP